MIIFIKTVTRKIACCLLVLSVAQQTIQAQCERPSEWQWKAHSRWFFGDGLFAHFPNGNGTISLSSIDTDVTKRIAYEGTSTISNEEGTLLYYTNGRTIWDADNTIVYSALLAGNENGFTPGNPGGNTTSAVQGVLFARHPSSPTILHVFTTDDAVTSLSNRKGLNYWKLNMTNNTVTGPVRLGSFLPTEQLTATFHANGKDIWIATRESGRNNKVSFQNLYCYLLTASGITGAPVVSSVAPAVQEPYYNLDMDRGALKFSWDGSRAVTVNHTPDWANKKDAIVVYDFDNETGQFSNARGVAAKWGIYTWDGDVYADAYDCEFSPDGESVYVSFVQAQIMIRADVTLSTATDIYNSIAVISNHASASCQLQLGGDGNLYQVTNADSLNVFSGNLNDGVSITQTALSAPDGRTTRRGFPNMFIPSADLELTVTPLNPFICAGDTVHFTVSGADEYTWSPSGSLSATTGNAVDAIPFQTTVYTVSGTNLWGCGEKQVRVTVSPCEPECAECVPSFAPIPGQRYLLSAWVKEQYDRYPETYKNSGIRLTFSGGSDVLFRPEGPIIDGWQRIEAAFTVPLTAADIEIELVNSGAPGKVYFDDIRIHPFRSNMKSFVYNPSTQKLTAELDENNYATLYEYDDEGILIRVKKETERGVMTIKETRTNQSKIVSGQ